MAYFLSALTWLIFLVLPLSNPFIWASSQRNSSSPTNITSVPKKLKNISAKNTRPNDGLVIGVIVEAERENDFQKAKQLLIKNYKKNAAIEHRVVRNDPYDVLQMVCNNLTSVQGLVFVCGEPCVSVTSFVSLIGMSGTFVQRRSEEHPPIFMDAPPAFLDIKPPLHEQNEALLQLMTQFQWQKICVIYQTDHHMTHLVEDLYNTLANTKQVRISQKIPLDGKNSTIDAGLKKAYGKVRVFVLLCSKRMAEIVLNRAKKQKLTTTEHAWIVGGAALENRETIPASFPIGLLGIEYNYKSHVDHIVDAIQTVHHGLEDLIQNNVTWQDTPIFNCYNDTSMVDSATPLYKAMKNISFKGLTGQVKFTQDGFRVASRYNFINLQKQRNTRQLIWRNVGYSDNGHVKLEQIVWPGGVVRTPSGVPRVRLRVVMYPIQPLVYAVPLNMSITDCQQGMKCTLVTIDKKEHPRCCYGLCIDLLTLISRDLVLEPEIRIIQNGRAGSLKKGRWTGVIGKVFDGEADMAMSSISITEERSKYIDFSAPFMHTGTTILVARRKGTFTGSGFLKPFEVRAWILLFVVLYLVAFLVYMLESKNPGLQRSAHQEYVGQFDIHASIWLIYSRLFGGNLDAHTPRFVSGRVVLGAWCFSALMLVALYTANLAAFMVQREKSYYIDGINDSRIRHPTDALRFTTILETSVGTYFKNNFPGTYKFMEKQYQVNQSEDGVQAVLDGKIDAFIWETVPLQQYAAKDPGCQLLVSGKPFDQTGYAAVFQKNSKWTKNVTDLILKYQTTSTSKEIHDKWQKSYCDKLPSTATIQPLGPTNLAGVFYMLLAGIGLSLLVLLGENIVNAVSKNMQQNETVQCTMTEQDRLRLQKDVANMDDVLQTSGLPDNQQLLSKMEQELKHTLMELQELQEITEKSFMNSSFRSINMSDWESSRSHEALGSMTFSDMKQIIEAARKGRHTAIRESSV